MKVKQVIKALKKAGFKYSHYSKHGVVYTHSDGRHTTIGCHYKNNDIPPGTLRAIEGQVGFRF